MTEPVPLGENEVARSRAVISMDGVLQNPHHLPANFINYNSRGKQSSKKLNNLNLVTHL